MPELPEIETIRLQLQPVLLGKIISDIQILEEKQFVGNPKLAFDKKVTNVERSGKILQIEISKNGEILYLSFHLKLSGQILFAKNKSGANFPVVIPHSDTKTMPGKTTRIIIEFSDNSALFFNDLRKFGWVKLGKTKEKPKGVDVLSSDFTLSYFTEAISGTKRAIKIVIMDQVKMAGIGNIYANDALWDAKINPSQEAGEVSGSKASELYDSIRKIINEGVIMKGSSAADELYILPDGTKGGYQNHFKVYGREKLPCLRCGDMIKKTVVGGRGTYYCPRCQN